MEVDVVEIVEIAFGGLHSFEFAAGIVDEGAKLADFLLAHGGAEDVGHFAADVAGSVFEDMLESLKLAMEVGHEMFGAFGEIQNRLKVNDFGSGSRGGGEGLREQFEHSAVGFNLLHGIFGSGLFGVSHDKSVRLMPQR